jgi:hypothetical protein
MINYDEDMTSIKNNQDDQNKSEIMEGVRLMTINDVEK